jgi:hypothetical protein
MEYINRQVIESLDDAAFRATKPYPWLNPERFITDVGFESLVETLPPPEAFERIFGKSRGKGGQQPHDRLSLEYHTDLPLAEPWRAFIGELQGPIYRRFLERMFGSDDFHLILHWHYTPTGCSVSPHCDSRKKLGSHIFYLNTDRDWRPEWGGQTLILDDNGQFPADSAPKFDDFERVIPSRATGNYSLLFMRSEHAWHGVKELRSPSDALRKVFIVVIERKSKDEVDRKNNGFGERVRGLFRND